MPNWPPWASNFVRAVVGNASGPIDDTNRLPVSLAGDDIPLPAGAATEVTLAAVLAAMGHQGVAGDTTITVGGTAQPLFSGATPTNGFAIYNPDPTLSLFVSDSTTALANGAGSIEVFPRGGYETPTGYKPVGAVSIVGAVTGQKITARRW